MKDRVKINLNSILQKKCEYQRIFHRCVTAGIFKESKNPGI